MRVTAAATESERWLTARDFPSSEPDWFLTPPFDAARLDKANYRKDRDVRDEHIARFGFAILDAATVEAILETLRGRPVLEVGAGKGYWSHELRKAGADAIATDPTDWLNSIYLNGRQLPDNSPAETWPVEQLTGLEALAKHGHGRALMMVWPPYDQEWPTDVLRAYQGDSFVLSGEGRGGCTGADSLFDALDRDWSEETTISNPQFGYINDSVTFYQRNET